MIEWLTPINLYYAIIGCMWVEYLFESYLCIRQRNVYKKTSEIPGVLKEHLDQATFTKSRNYGMDKNRFTMFSELYGMIVLTVLLHFNGLYEGWKLGGPALAAVGIWPKDWNDEIGRSIMFMIIALLFNNVVGLPLSIYATFVLEERHGFNKQTPSFFVKDLIKKILVSVVIMSPFVGLIVKIVQAGGPYFFIYLWAFCFGVLMFLMTIYPMVIAPLFDKYTPLKEGPLKDRIETLAKKINFPLTKLYVVEGSKRSAHSNAYLYGFFSNKRVVLYDTLLQGYKVDDTQTTESASQESEASTTGSEQAENVTSTEKVKGCTDVEVEAVLGHEFGHWKLNHVTKNIVISQINLLFVFFFFKVCYQAPIVYQAFGFPVSYRESEMPVLIGLIIVLQFILQIYNTAMGYIMNVLSRHFEFEADKHAVDLGYPEELKRALIKLNVDNLGFPVSDSLYSSWHHSHPTLLQRIEAIDQRSAELGKAD